jgi:hypothetical protein
LGDLGVIPSAIRVRGMDVWVSDDFVQSHEIPL